MGLGLPHSNAWGGARARPLTAVGLRAGPYEIGRPFGSIFTDQIPELVSLNQT